MGGMWERTSGGALVNGPYSVIERIDGRGWNACVEAEGMLKTLAQGVSSGAARVACETHATPPRYEVADMFKERASERKARIEKRAKEIVEQEQYEAEVQARAAEIRAYYGLSLWQRLLQKLPFTVQRRTE